MFEHTIIKPIIWIHIEFLLTVWKRTSRIGVEIHDSRQTKLHTVQSWKLPKLNKVKKLPWQPGLQFVGFFVAPFWGSLAFLNGASFLLRTLRHRYNWQAGSQPPRMSPASSAASNTAWHSGTACHDWSPLYHHCVFFSRSISLAPCFRRC